MTKSGAENREEIMKIIDDLWKKCDVLEGIQLSLLFREVKKKNVLAFDKYIANHLKILELQGKIKVRMWTVFKI